MDYSHTQRAPLHLLLHGLGFVMLLLALLSDEAWPVPLILIVVGSLFVLVALMFKTMTVCDEGEFLAIRYGPLPVFQHRIRYTDISSVEAARSSIIDGWGIHWIPGRGTTYNLWGFQCARLTVSGKTVRIGTDDVDGLVGFLAGKLGS